MNVDFITVSNERHRRTYRHELDTALVAAAYGDEFNRIAFGGKTRVGRSGIALDIYDLKISGHKIERIPEDVCDLVVHFPLSEARHALRTLVEGEDVLIGTPEHGILIRRYGEDLQVFGAGEDSHQPP